MKKLYMNLGKIEKPNNDDIAVTFSEEQLNILRERILKEEEGRAVYRDAREVVWKIKNKMKNV